MILIGGSFKVSASPLFVHYRVEDHDDIMHLFAEQTKHLSADEPYFLAELIEAQNEENHTAVYEVCSTI